MPKARVLIVEDDNLVRELITEALGEAGFQVDQAETGDRRQS
jgi:DNA-binding response OmpR family regulator